MFRFRLVEWPDRDALWDWYCEPLRQIAFGTKCSITYDRHCSWLRKVMKDQDSFLTIGLLDNLRICAVRFDQGSETDHEVSVYLKPNYCGRGYLPEILQESAKYLSEMKPVRKLRATLNRRNPAVVQGFLTAGYSIEQSGPDEVQVGRVVEP